jgi:ribokinase
MVGRVGADAQGAWLREGLWTERVGVEHVREDRQAPTGVALIAVDARGENTIVVSPGANARVDARDVAAASEVVGGAEVVLVQHEVPREAVAAAIATAGGTVVLNPAPARGLAAPVDVLVPNRGELETLAGGRGDPVTLARSITAARSVVVTLGAEGAVVVEGDRAERVRAPRVEVVDTTGAGDAFCGALAEAMAGGATVVEAARWAVRVAAVSVTRPGAQGGLPRREDVPAGE